MAHPARAYPDFLSMKRLGLLQLSPSPLPLMRCLSIATLPSSISPGIHNNFPAPIYKSWVERGFLREYWDKSFFHKTQHSEPVRSQSQTSQPWVTSVLTIIPPSQSQMSRRSDSFVILMNLPWFQLWIQYILHKSLFKSALLVIYIKFQVCHLHVTSE